MEEKQSIKVSLGTVICTIIIILLIVSLFGMWYYYNNKINGNYTKSDNTSDNNIYEKAINENNTEKDKIINKIDQDKELVYPLYSTFFNEYSFSIPCINIKSSYVENINKEIENFYKPIIEEVLKKERAGQNIEYKAYLNDNVLSLIIVQLVDDCKYYKTYNIDIYSGKQLTNLEILNQKHITENDFLNKLETIYYEEFIRSYKELKETDLYKTQLNNTTSKDNYSITTPIFLGENCTINIIAKIYSLAGAEYYYRIVDTKI